jgi:hypothetical protein
MLADAFEDEPERSRREPAVDQLVCVDRDLGDVLAVVCVEMRRRVLAEVS